MGARMLALLALCAGCATYEPGPVSITLDETQSGKVWFMSKDAYDFPDMTSGAAPDRVIEGELTLPPDDVALRGGIILSHGSGGPNSIHERVAAELAQKGFITFRLDHFGPRNVGSTARDQIRITAQGMLLDVTAAQAFLATHPKLSADRIGHIGWSKGGITALSAAVDRLSGYAQRPAPLAFAAAFYPFCLVDLGDEKLSSPLLIQIGAEDNWTPAPPCRDLVAEWQANGQPAEIEVYPGARHGFDSRAPDLDFGSAITIRDFSVACRLRVDKDGRTVSIDGKSALTDQAGRIAYLRACGTRGVAYGGNATARAASMNRLMDFIDRHLP